MPDDSTSFTITDAADVLAPYVAAERRRDAVWQADFDRLAEQTRGLSQYIGEPPRARSEDEIKAAAKANLDAARAWEISPKGRLYAAIVELEQTGYGEPAYTMRGVFDRSLFHSETVDAKAVGAILILLAPIATPTAQEAIEACAELLLSERRAAA